MTSCLICGCVKNCEQYLDKVFNNIEKIQKLFIKSKIIISFDISNDFTLKKIYLIMNEINYSLHNNKIKFLQNKLPSKSFYLYFFPSFAPFSN